MLFLPHEKEDLPLLIKITEYKRSQPNYDVIITNWPAAFLYLSNTLFSVYKKTKYLYKSFSDLYNLLPEPHYSIRS